MHKLIQLVKRAEGISPEEFGRSWPDAVRRHVGAIADGAAGGVAGLGIGVVRHGRTEAPWDGVAIGWYDHPADAGPAAIGPVDVTRTTTIPVWERRAFGDAWLDTLWADAAASTSLLVGFIERLPGLDQVEFAAYWWDRHRPLADALIPAELQPTAYVHDYVDVAAASGWDGIGELYETTDVARSRAAWFATDDAVPLVADEDRFLVRSTRAVLVTDFEVIVPRLADRSGRGG